MFKHSFLYEINAVAFLKILSVKYGRSLTLSSIPDQEWQHIKDLGFEYVWLMGVWQRSEGSKKCALADPQLRKDYDIALTGWEDKDVIGSPYAIYSYTLDSNLGKEEELAQLRIKLNQIGLGLILDFVVNHLAVDHPWVQAYPDRFISTEKDVADIHTDLFYKTGNNHYIAHGRDPNYPGWTDTAQLNLFSDDLRKALIEEINRIAQVADGVRCDMAMLALNDVFINTWSDFIKDRSPSIEEFWKVAIDEVRKKLPEFIFIAESYWDFEWNLQQLGFDYTYDKKLYDRLRSEKPVDIRDHLRADQTYQKKSVRFIENHDEERCVVSFGLEQSKVAAIVVATIPGLCMVFDGQLDGKKIKAPVQLGRINEEEPIQEIHEFYHLLFSFCNDSLVRDGQWALLNAEKVWDNNESNANILCWQWYAENQTRIIIVNYSSTASQGRVKIPLDNYKKSSGTFYDCIKKEKYTRDIAEIIDRGLFVDLDSWDYHLLTLEN